MYLHYFMARIVHAVIFTLFCLLAFLPLLSGTAQDTTLTVSDRVVTLKEVVVRNNLNVPAFIGRVQRDTSFYKAFKNLKVLGYTALNDIRMTDKKGKVKSTLQSKSRQSVVRGCRTMEILEEKVTGDMYDHNRNWNYYTAELYAGLFFVTGTRCGENNIVSGGDLNVKSKSGIARHKEQLKMLFFNPGVRIPGIPFIGDKIALFEENVARNYDFVIDMADHQGQNCYVFLVKAREDLTAKQKDQVVVNTITTWFNSQTMEIVARDYDMSYDAGVYDFDVHMEVQMDKFGDYLVPRLIRYTGNWHALFKKREKGFFTATLFDFNR